MSMFDIGKVQQIGIVLLRANAAYEAIMIMIKDSPQKSIQFNSIAQSIICLISTIICIDLQHPITAI